MEVFKQNIRPISPIAPAASISLMHADERHIPKMPTPANHQPTHDNQMTTFPRINVKQM